MQDNKCTLSYKDIVIENRKVLFELLNKDLASIKSVKIQFLCSYMYGDNGGIVLYEPGCNYEYDYRCLHHTGVIVGYKLKNVDNVNLTYLKATYTEDGIKYHPVEIKPNEEFIITRHELDFLMYLNGGYLVNGVICRGNWTNWMPNDTCHNKWDHKFEYSKEDAQRKTAYIRHKDYEIEDGIESVREKEVIYQIGKLNSDKKWGLLEKYRDAFYWVEMPQYMKRFENKTNISQGKPKHRYTRKSDEVLIDDYDADLYLCNFELADYKTIIIAGDRTEKFITNFINTANLLGKSKIIKHDNKYTVLSVDDALYIYSTYSIVINPRQNFKEIELDKLDISKAKLYGHTLKHTFYKSTINNLIIGDVETEEPNGFIKIFSNMNIGSNIQTTNQALNTLIENYNEQR